MSQRSASPHWRRSHSGGRSGRRGSSPYRRHPFRGAFVVALLAATALWFLLGRTAATIVGLAYVAWLVVLVGAALLAAPRRALRRLSRG